MRIAIAALLTALAINAEAQVTQKDNRYVYCNVFLETACFGIAQGDNLNMQIPFDFLLYGIKFSFGGSAQIFSGFNPERIDSNSVLISSNCGRKSDSCNLYRVAQEQYRLLFEVDGDFLDVSLSGISIDNFEEFNSFLHNFRHCSRSGSGVMCGEERIFYNLQINPPDK
jgi:hypothetical protein